MNITAAALRSDRVTWVIAIAVLLAGMAAYKALPRAEDPGFDWRIAQVVTQFPGASPERVEQLITDKLEAAIQEIPELDHISSRSRSGVSIINVFIKENETVMRPIYDNLRRKVERVQPQLPDGAYASQVNDEFADVYGIVIALTGEGYNYAELKDVADEVRDELLILNSVAKVDIYGAQPEQVHIDYNNARLAELGLSPGQLVEVLSSRNIIVPGGSLTTDDERIVVEPSGSFESVDDLARSLVRLPGGAVTALEDIATITRGYADPPAAKFSANGTPGLALALALTEGGNIMHLGDEVQTLLARLKVEYPIGVDFELLAFQPEDVARITQRFRVNLFQAVAVVSLVMLLFLGLRTGFVVATLIPTSLVSAMLVMQFLGIGIDQVSLAALILALGMLVDNAIVVTENTLVNLKEGKSRFQAAVQSADELRVPLLTASLTTAAAFLPIYLAESKTGEYMAPLFLVVTITLLCSWVIALTLLPLLSVRLLKVKPATSDKATLGQRLYRRVLFGALKIRLLLIPAVVLLFLFAMQGFAYLPNIFFPDSDKPVLRAELELPPGSPMARSEQVVQQFEAFIAAELTDLGAADQRDPSVFDRIADKWAEWVPALAQPENDEVKRGVRSWAAYTGSSGPRFVLQHQTAPNRRYYSFIQLNVTGDDVSDEVIAKLRAFAAEGFPDLRFSVNRIEFGPPVEHPVEIRLSGKDQNQLLRMADDVAAQLATVEGAENIGNDWGNWTKKVRVRVDEARARRAGVTNRDVAISMQSGLSGLELTQYREGDQIIPVTLRSEVRDARDLVSLRTLNVYSQATGTSVPLQQVADVELIWQPAIVIRRDGRKTVTVFAELANGKTAVEVNNDIEPWLIEQRPSWGPGYRWEFGGEVESSNESNKAIAEKMSIGLFVILLLLVAQFNSIRKTAIVLATVPLALIGVVAGLLLAKSYMGFTTTLGIVSLIGIVINNAIVLLERVEIESETHDAETALILAAQRRLRPILLTTATTVLGMLPLWLGGGIMWEPLAVSMIFGLLFSTVLTLFVIPALYAVLYRLNYRGRKLAELVA